MTNNQYYFVDKPLRETIRKEKRDLRESLSLDEVNQKSLKIKDNLFSLKLLEKESLIASYVSTKNEVSTDLINQDLLNKGHTLALPAIDFSKKGHMSFYKTLSLESLILNKYNIKEPDSSKSDLIQESLIEIILLPLVAFDLKGNRLGMGGGYYDRILKKVSANTYLIGLSFEFQKTKEIRNEYWDMPLDMVITESSIYNFNKYKK